MITRRVVHEYIVKCTNASELFDCKSVQKLIEYFQALSNAHNIPLSNIKIDYHAWGDECDEAGLYYERPESDEELEKRLSYVKKHDLATYERLRKELMESGLLDENGNPII